MPRSLFCLLLLARHAAADVDVPFRSTGRAVEIEIAGQRCITPCSLRVTPGEHQARVDGLDRRVLASEDAVVITPTRYPRLVLALSLITLGAAGLSLAGHESSPLSNEGRLAAGLAGAAMVGLAVPITISSSAKIGRARSERTDLFVGYHGEDMLALGVGYRPHAVGLGAQLRGRFGTDRYQFAGGATLHGPRLARVRPAVAAHVGLAELRGASTPANLAMEIPAQPGAVSLRATFELEARIELEVPLPIWPSIGVTARTLPDRVLTLDAGVHLAF